MPPPGPELRLDDFAEIAKIVYDNSGILLGPTKRSLVDARLRGRMRQTGDKTLTEYIQRVRSDKRGAELRTLLDLVSTNVTSFFRETHHFEHLASQVPQLRTRAHGVLRVWSAACSSGQEPYSIAMTLARAYGANHLMGFLILATDISTRVLKSAQAGVYPERELKSIPSEQRRTWFSSIGLQKERVAQPLRERVRIRRLNLQETWPLSKPMDVIFCRNVLIYFDKASQERLARRFHNQLRPGGFLYIGHSESFSGLDHPLESVAPTIYRRPLNGA